MATDSSVLLNVATKIDLLLGAAESALQPSGGRCQLFAFRALLSSLAKAGARFVLDLSRWPDLPREAGQLMTQLGAARAQPHLAVLGEVLIGTAQASS